jgi:hypothetical protein
MKRIIITLALVALASTAWAQATPEVTLPQYQPPSYSSPHGGTGMDFTHHIKPHTPNITAPQSGGYGGTADTYVVPYDRPPETASPEEKIKAVEDYYRRRNQLHINNLKRMGDPRLR